MAITQALPGSRRELQVELLAPQERRSQARVEDLAGPGSSLQQHCRLAGRSPVEASRALHVHLPGGFHTAVGNQDVCEPSSDRSATGIKLLVRDPTPSVHPEHLRNTLWPKRDPTAVANNLRVALCRVGQREMIAAARIVRLPEQASLLIGDASPRGELPVVYAAARGRVPVGRETLPGLTNSPADRGARFVVCLPFR